MRHLVPGLQRTRRAEQHPLVKHVRTDETGPHFLRVLDNLLTSAATPIASLIW